MAAEAEAGAHDAAADRLAHQELLRALAGLVVVVDDAVVGRLIAIEFLGFAADGQRREQHVVVARVGVLVARIQHLEAIARRRAALEVDVVGIDAHQIVDHRARDLVAQRGLVDALIEPHRRGVVLVVLLGLRDLGAAAAQALHVDRRRTCRCRTARPRLRRAVADHDHAHDAQPAAVGREQDAQLLSLAQAAVASAGPENGDKRADIFGPKRPDRAGWSRRTRPSSPRPRARSRHRERSSWRRSWAASVMFSGNDARLEPRIGVDVALGRVGGEARAGCRARCRSSGSR